MKPNIHAKSSARKYGGKMEDYLPIHQLMDSTKGALGDNRHRCVTHNADFIRPGGMLETIFGVTITNSDGREVAVRDIGEQHILEDFGGKFIPTLQDWLQGLPMEDWMNGGAGNPPPSYQTILEGRNKKLEAAIKGLMECGELKIPDFNAPDEPDEPDYVIDGGKPSHLID